MASVNEFGEPTKSRTFMPLPQREDLEGCLFLAYPAHQQPATRGQTQQLQATRNSLAGRRISSNQQLEATGGKTQQMASVSAVNRRVVGSSPT